MRFLLLFLSLFFISNNSFSQNLSLTDYLDTAAIFKESSEYEKVIEILEKGRKNLRLRPRGLSIDDDDRLKEYLARVKFLNGSSFEALTLFKIIKKKTWQNYLYLGLAYEDLGKEGKAIECYQKSLKIRPNSISLLRLGKIYRNMGNFKEAIGCFRRLIKVDSSIRLVHYYLGDCLHREGEYKSAYRYLSKAINFYPSSNKIKNLLETVKLKVGDDFFIAKAAEKEKKRKKTEFKTYQPKKGIPLIRIGLGKNLNKFSFSCAADFTISDNKSSFKAQNNKLYTISLEKGLIALSDYETKSNYQYFSGSLDIISAHSREKSPFYILDVTYGKNEFWHKQMDRAYRGDLEVIKEDKGFVLVNILSIEDYLDGVIAAEISYKVNINALRAQAIAARTIAFRNLKRHQKEGFNLCADIHCQVYHGLSGETTPTIKAINDTQSQVLTYGDKIIETFYHSNCSGCLAADVFGKNEYLVNKIDARGGYLPDSAYAQEEWFLKDVVSFCADKFRSTSRWQRVYDAQDFLFIFGFDIQELKSILPIEKGDCFHCKQISIITSNSKKVLIGDLNIRNYFDKLRSSAFKMELKLSSQKTPSMLIFWGGGFGHGTGLCQQGAIAMADQGHSYQEILKHYYPKTKLKRSTFP